MMMAVLLAAILAVTGLFVVMRGGRGDQASTVSVENQNPPADSVRVDPAAASTPETAEADPADASVAAPVSEPSLPVPAARTDADRTVETLRAREAAGMTAADRAFLSKHGILCNSDRSLDALRRDPRSLVLRTAIIDTRLVESGGANVDIPEDYLASADGTRFLVQFSDAFSADRQRKALEAAGATVEHYVPNRAFAVTASDEVMRRILTVEGVAYVQPFHPFFAAPPEVRTFIEQGRANQGDTEPVEADFNLLLFSDADMADRLADLGAEVHRRVGGGNLEIGELHASAAVVEQVIKSGLVKWVEQKPDLKAMNDRAGWTTRFRTVRMNYPGVDGGGVRVAVTDTGVDDRHRAFALDPSLATAYPSNNTRIAYYSYLSGGAGDGLQGDASGHGTHVAGSVLGSGAESTTVLKSPGSRVASHGGYAADQFQGVAPRAQLVMIEDFNSHTATQQVEIAYQHGARLLNNSWGASDPFYGTASMEWDALVRDALPTVEGKQELITFFAAGNDGNGTADGLGGDAGTIASPGNAKNVITVGAVEQRRRAENLPTQDSLANSDTDWQMAGFSSRGPTPDGRIKPDLCAPGLYVLSAQSGSGGAPNTDSIEFGEWPFLDYRHKNVDSGPKYAFLQGTSMSTPLTAGMGALLFQWYTNAYNQAPSPAMMKALLVNGAMDLDSIQYERDVYGGSIIHDGWGLVDLVGSMAGPRIRASDEVRLYDQEDSVADVKEPVTLSYTVTEANQGGLKVVLTWTDAPGTAGNLSALANDLDLVVTAPDGTVYMGNLFGRMIWGTASYGLGNYIEEIGDRWNNVEVVLIRDTLPGVYEIKIKGYNLPAGSQNFALAVTRGVSTAGDIGGSDSDLALDAQQFPVLATAVHQTGDADPTMTSVIGVRHWVGGYGEGPEFGTWRRLRGKWFHYGSEWESEIISGAVTGAQVSAPSVAVDKNTGKIYVAWLYKSFDTSNPDCIYLRHWNGTSWTALGGSYDNLGICDPGIQWWLRPFWRPIWTCMRIIRCRWWPGTK